jgi:hypothetical protein
MCPRMKNQVNKNLIWTNYLSSPSTVSEKNEQLREVKDFGGVDMFWGGYRHRYTLDIRKC